MRDVYEEFSFVLFTSWVPYFVNWRWPRLKGWLVYKSFSKGYGPSDFWPPPWGPISFFEFVFFPRRFAQKWKVSEAPVWKKYPRVFRGKVGPWLVDLLRNRSVSFSSCFEQSAWGRIFKIGTTRPQARYFPSLGFRKFVFWVLNSENFLQTRYFSGLGPSRCPKV